MNAPLTYRRPPPGPAAPIRVLVVDDSVVQRNMLVALLDAEAGLEVVGWAADGAEAVRTAARLRPSVITMDLRMPVMDGLEAARRIMQDAPVPIVLVTASASRENQQLVFAAFQAGVLAVVPKPRPGPGDEQSVRTLLRTVKSLAEVKVIRHWKPDRLRPNAGARAPLAARPSRPPEIVGLGASTGGPEALQHILTDLPATFPLPILVVQHISPGFESGLVDWLRPQCGLPVQLAAGGQRLTRGIHVAPTGQHLTVRGRVLGLTGEPTVSGHRPSVTVLFQSLAREYGRGAIGVLLTGMGDDGAAGLRDLKQVGGVTVAQDEASSTVFGMPAAAIGMGVVDHVLPPPAIAGLLLDLVRPGGEA